MERLGALIEEHIGPNAIVGTEDAPVIVLASGDPTPEQQALIAELLVFWRSGVTGITFAEWQALDAAMADDRALRQMTRAEFLAQTTAQKERQVFDVLTAHSKMLRALIRDRR